MFCLQNKLVGLYTIIRIIREIRVQEKRIFGGHLIRFTRFRLLDKQEVCENFFLEISKPPIFCFSLGLFLFFAVWQSRVQIVFIVYLRPLKLI